MNDRLSASKSGSISGTLASSSSLLTPWITTPRCVSTASPANVPFSGNVSPGSLPFTGAPET